MPSLAVSSLSAPAISNAWPRLSSTHGPAMSASGNSLPKRALPTATTTLGFTSISVLAGDHEGGSEPGQRASLHRREHRGPQKRALDIGDNRPVLLAVVARLVPSWVCLKCVPFLLAVGKRFPSQQ